LFEELKVMGSREINTHFPEYEWRFFPIVACEKWEGGIVV
jgi:hypothetical protein